MHMRRDCEAHGGLEVDSSCVGLLYVEALKVEAVSRRVVGELTGKRNELPA
jgi:hypothetical protein